MIFDINEFLRPFDPWVIAMAILLGVVMGFRMRQLGPRMSRSRVFWQMVDGAVFFVPLAVIRAFEGSTAWERLLATLPLWIIYVAAMRFGNSFEWDRLPGNRDRHRALGRWPETGERRHKDKMIRATLSAPYVGPRRRASDHRR